MTYTIMEKVVRVARIGAALGALIALLASMPLAARAQASNPARCEALKLQKESAYFRCLSRCDRRVAAGRVDAADCDDRCEARFDAAVFRVEQRTPCQPDPTPEPDPDPEPEPGEQPEPRVVEPDPEHCEAQLLRIQSRHLICRVRCATRAARNDRVDQAACEARCDGRCQAAIDRTLAKPVCAAGRVAEGEMRPVDQ